MIGDCVLIYDKRRDRYFAGWLKQAKTYAEEPPTPIWADTMDQAKITKNIAWAHGVVKRFGEDFRVISETTARRLDALREYRMKENRR